MLMTWQHSSFMKIKKTQLLNICSSHVTRSTKAFLGVWPPESPGNKLWVRHVGAAGSLLTASRRVTCPHASVKPASVWPPPCCGSQGIREPPTVPRRKVLAEASDGSITKYAEFHTWEISFLRTSKFIQKLIKAGSVEIAIMSVVCLLWCYIG